MSAESNIEILRKQAEAYDLMFAKQRLRLDKAIKKYFNSDPANWWKKDNGH